MFLRFTWASLVAQTVKNLPAMQETQVRSLIRKLHWRRVWHPTPVILPGEVHGQKSLVGYSPWGGKESDTTEPPTLSLSHCHDLHHASVLPFFLKILFIYFWLCWVIQRSPVSYSCSREMILSLRGRERIPGVPFASQEEALSTGKARGTPGSCQDRKSVV